MENMKRDPGRFLAREEPPTSSQQDTDAGIKRIKQEPAIDDLNDLKLSLLQCGDVESLGSMVKAGLSGAVPGYGGALFYQDVDIAEIFTADSSGVHVCSPKPDCISNVFTSSQPVYADVSNIPQCVLQHLPNNSSSTASKVGCLPVCKDGQVLSVFVVFGNDFNESTTVRLHTVIQQIAACYNHIQRSFQSTRNVEERVSQQLIKLCGELYDQDAAQLQLKVLRYLEEQTQAECAFLYLVVPETQELFCQVIGKKILQEEERFPGLTSVFSSTLETKQPMGLEDIPMEGRKALEEKIGCPLRSFLCVPVTSRIDDNLIALSCLANKHHATRFTERDISCIRQCFRYTSTVLTSTLAFQNERKLKTQTQALLQVARDLFTNLGKLNQKYCSSIDNFPVIESRGCWTNVCAHGLFCSRSYLNMFTEQITNKYLNGNWLSLLIDEYVAKPAEKCEPGAGNGFVSVDQLNDRVWKGVDDSSGKDRTDTDQPALCLMSDIDDKAASDIEKNVLQNEEKTITVAKNFDLTIYNDTVITEEKLNEYRKKLNQSVGNQAEKVRTGIETINANGEELKRVTQTTVDNVSEKLSCSICASDSPLLFESANSEWERNSDSSLNTAEDAYLDSSVYLIADAKNLLVYRPDILGFSDVKTDQPNQSESEPICALEVYPIYVDSRAELNEAFHTECMDDTVHYITNDSVEDMPGCNDSIDTGMFGSDKVIDSSVVEEKNHEEHLNGAARNYQNCSEGVIECSRKAEEVFVNDANIRMMQVPPIFNMNDLTKLLREIMQQARNLTHAERCSVFLIDHDTDELVAKVFDGITPNKDNEVQEEIRMPITQGIAGKVATSGELLNIKDAYSHPLFYRGIDVSTGFRTRSILCFPIKDETGRMLGVAQLCNKQNCPCFTTFDEEIATAFGIYCCISISHSLMYKKVIDSQVRNSLANELMMYHMKSLMYKKLLDLQHRKSLANELMIYHMQVSPEDVHGLSKVDIPHPRFLNSDFVQFSYAPRCLSEDRTLLACLSMFEDLNLISRWKIRRETLARFVLMVKKGYRNPPYHNWMHAYTVAQFCYQLIKNLKLENSLDDIEMFSLFISCLCHDIDHRGTNNSFQTASRSVLAALYSSEESVLEKSVLAALYSSEGSVLERHHFAQTMCILNTEGCNVFENLNSKDYQHVLDLMRDIILATDVAHHFKILKNLREMADRGYEKVSKKDRKLLLCLLMTSCDLSDQTRPWDNTKRVAALIYKEFFSQGDMEKAKGLEPIDMMDRERAQIPALQIGFLDHVALPVYRLLGKMFPECVEIGERVEDNKQHWDKISGLIKLKRGGSQARMTFEEVLAIENEDDDGHSEIMNGTG